MILRPSASISNITLAKGTDGAKIASLAVTLSVNGSAKPTRSIPLSSSELADGSTSLELKLSDGGAYSATLSVLALDSSKKTIASASHTFDAEAEACALVQLELGPAAAADAGVDSAHPDSAPHDARVDTVKCGNDFIDDGEKCDGKTLGGRTCISEQMAGGTLRCKSDCSALDYSECTWAARS